MVKESDEMYLLPVYAKKDYVNIQVVLTPEQIFDQVCELQDREFDLFLNELRHLHYNTNSL